MCIRDRAWGERRFVVTGWAGPWPVDEGWWSTDASGERVARMQVVGREVSRTGEQAAAPTGWLLVWSRRSWRVEAVY